MLRNDVIKKTEKEIEFLKKLDIMWTGYEIDREKFFLEEDQPIIDSPIAKSLKEKLMWKDDEKAEYSFSFQFPVPINGNFLTAKYLLLYSNPGTEKMEIPNVSKKELLKCFNLDKDAKLVIPNQQWFKWYIGELDKFYIGTHKPNELFDWDEFSSDFCFINFLAYPTKENTFDFTEPELKLINELPSTQYVKELVRIGIKLGKRILVIRRSEGVWKHHSKKKNNIFKKLDYSYKEDALKKAMKHYNNDNFDDAKVIFNIFKEQSSMARKYLKRIKEESGEYYE